MVEHRLSVARWCQPSQLRRLTALVPRLPDGEHVELLVDDQSGKRRRLVADRANVQADE